MTAIQTFRVRLFSLLACTAATALTPVHAQAEGSGAYPDQPIRFVVPYPPGGLTDRIARTLGQKMQEAMGQPVIIDNRGGAGATIGTDFVAKSKPDGYTILLGVNASHAVNVSLMKLPYDPAASFAPISLMVTVPNMLMVNAQSPMHSIDEFLATAKAKPGTLTYTSVGVGTVGHMAMELLSSMTGIQMVHVPAKGPAQAVTDALGGHVDVIVDSLALSMPLVKSGKLRALAVTSLERSPAAPQLPTMAESGLPGYEIILWFGLYAPAGTPPAIIAKLNEATRKAFADPAVSQPLVAEGITIVTSSPEKLAEFQRNETLKYAKLLKAWKLKPD